MRREESKITDSGVVVIYLFSWAVPILLIVVPLMAWSSGPLAMLVPNSGGRYGFSDYGQLLFFPFFLGWFLLYFRVGGEA